MTMLIERGRGAGYAPLGELTPAEQRVLVLMAAGLSNVGIAERLVLSDRTVENYVRFIFIKLGLLQERGANRRVRAVLRFLAARERCA